MNHSEPAIPFNLPGLASHMPKNTASSPALKALTLRYVSVHLILTTVRALVHRGASRPGSKSTFLLLGLQCLQHLLSWFVTVSLTGLGWV